jgi:hypothetical protein
VLFGLGIGCRASTLLIALAWLVAERIGADEEDVTDRRSWRATLVTGGVLVGVGALCFLPPWIQAGRSLDFLDNELAWVGLGTHGGRWLVKNLATTTLPGAVVLVVGGRHLLSGVTRWNESVVVRFAVLTIVLGELLFLRLPLKTVHLLPVIAAAALLVGTAALRRRRWIVGLIAAQLLAAFVGTTIAAPDVPDRSDSGQLSFRIADGAIVNDVRCRVADLDRGDWHLSDSAAERAESTARAEANFVCQRDAWRDS